jgi:hypothetical protein
MAAPHVEPVSGNGCKKSPFGFTVYFRGPLATAVTDRLKVLVVLYPDLCLVGVFQNRLLDNFDSTKREIGCYSGFGHRTSDAFNL